MTHSEEISLRPLKNALKTLNEGLLIKPATKIVQDGVIQRFEYTYELAWKTVKRYFDENQNLIEFNAKDIWREAARQGLVTNVKDWFGFHQARNRTADFYGEKVAKNVYKMANNFAECAGELVSNLETKI